jgi:hypothetical protein
MIKIFVLYVGIIAAIKNHTNDHCHGKVFGHVYIYSNPLGHTLKGLASIEYELGIRSKGERDSKSGCRSVKMVPIYHRWFQKGPKPYRRYIGRCRKKLGQTGLFIGSLKWSGRLWKVPESTGMTQAFLGSPEGSIICLSMFP